MNTVLFSSIINAEINLHHRGVFVNGLTYEESNMNDEYTVVNYKQLEVFVKSHKVEKDVIIACIEYWLTDSQSGRPIKLVAQCIKRWLGNGIYDRLLFVY